MTSKSKHPMQPIILDRHGIARFKRNNLVCFILDNWVQLAQLIGYSVSGFGDLHYADKHSVRKADRRVKTLLGNKR